MCMMRNPKTLSAKARFKTAGNPKGVIEIHVWHQQLELCFETLPKARKVVAREPGVPGISPSLKNAKKCGSNDAVTRVVSRKV